MAIAKLQAPLAGLRGKYGGMIFSANGTGNYVKQWVMPTYSNSLSQNAHRINFTAVSRAWNSLSQAQIDVWKTLAHTPPELDYNSLGVLISLNAFQWFMRINTRRIQAAQEIELDAPPNVTVATPTSLSLTIYDSLYSAGEDRFTYTSDNFATSYAVLYLATSASLVRQVASTGFRSIWCGGPQFPTYSVINTKLISAFGWLSVGQKIFGELRRQSYTGIRSLPRLATTLVAPAP